MDYPGLEEASSGCVGTGVKHKILRPINGMASRVSMFARAEVAVSAFCTAL